MAHNFVKQIDGSKVCSWCGDERGVDSERNCPKANASGGRNYSHYYSPSMFRLILSNFIAFYLPLFSLAGLLCLDISNQDWLLPPQPQEPSSKMLLPVASIVAVRLSECWFTFI